MVARELIISQLKLGRLLLHGVRFNCCYVINKVWIPVDLEVGEVVLVMAILHSVLNQPTLPATISDLLLQAVVCGDELAILQPTWLQLSLVNNLYIFGYFLFAAFFVFSVA